MNCKIHLAMSHVLHKTSMSLFFQSVIKYRTNICPGLAQMVLVYAGLFRIIITPPFTLTTNPGWEDKYYGKPI